MTPNEMAPVSPSTLRETVERALLHVAQFHGDQHCFLNCLHSEALAGEVLRLRTEVDTLTRAQQEAEQTIAALRAQLMDGERERQAR